MNKKFYKKQQGKKLCGVCGGLAEILSIDASLLRIIWAVLAICSASIFFWIYVVAAIVLPWKEDAYINSVEE